MRELIDWNATWNEMKFDHQRLEDDKRLFDDVFCRPDDAGRVAKAEASVTFARELCRFLTKYRDMGVFDAILDPPEDQAEARVRVAEHLQDVLRDELELLERAGLPRDSAKSLLDESLQMFRPPYPIVSQDVWTKRVDEGIGAACKVPRTAVLLLAENLTDYVKTFSRKHGLATTLVIGTANIVLLKFDPTLILPTKVSKYLAVLVGHGS